MKSVILITPERLNLDRLLDEFDSLGSAYLQSPDRLVVEGHWGWFAVDRSNGLEKDFCSEELAKIHEVMPKAYFSQLEYRNLDSVNKAIKTMNVDMRTLIDNDHGLVAQIDKIRHRIDAGIDWHVSPD